MMESNLGSLLLQPGLPQLFGSQFNQRVQRAFDFIGAATGVAVLSPLFLVIGVLVKLSDGGPVLHRSTRVGKDGRLFTLLKFRSMTPGAAKHGARITKHHDVRVTRVGKILRRFKLDEFPQLMNVLRGELSFVGPRPEDPQYVALYTPEQRKVLTVRPGITSIASLQYKDEESLLTGDEWERIYIEEVLPKKLAIELEYMPQRTMMKDLKIILRTLGGIFT